ncbi:Endonuclease/exonuclease/phosphatase [Hygrophoropsis aurantiaca]|uniref:Endonuclease/exonuclease/phosphatase n=1 Tax=Hygrophoropsis aurantiaca TaxID=72124 RepID=A0ACB8AGC9_9AGAM|nr:Endonuclease/exonuclease/phosphatase [Hygrophoropsis aurantiaca]
MVSQPTVLSRLQALFPASPSSSTFPNLQQDEAIGTASRPQLTKKPPKFLKIRVVTWNMHDSVPKGDLEELLGHVLPYKQGSLSVDVSSLPDLPADTTHPYHLVVVAGQECPSTSGLPMALGAGFKLIDKEKEREKDKTDDAHSEKHHHKRKDKEREIWKSIEDLTEELIVHHPSGWTSLLEHWLCHRTQANSYPNSIQASEQASRDAVSSPKRSSLHRRLTVKEKDKGPYVPLIKERMMGLYLSIYIHRDIRDMVTGTSKSAVTAGLIGGRVGNKGGVGISLKIENSTFLFLNAHLAAHEGKVNHRLANLAKIKTELSVDDFLAPDDPRVMAEDITDRFDYTFLCGDLNFRLDISRLHADWLISRQEYTEALAFDQLRKQMADGDAFAGFKEAPIDFPPTFKYDVPSRSKTKASRRHSKRPEKEHSGNDGEDREGGGDEEEGEEEGDGEARSLSSSVWTSVHSKAAGTDTEDDDYFSSHAPPPHHEGSKVALSAAAHKAKEKWKAFLSPSLAQSPPASPLIKWWRTKHGLADNHGKETASVDNLAKGPTDEKLTQVDSQEKEYLLPPRPASRGPSVKSAPPTANDQIVEEDDKPAYDSSHKQRVPSWCDRILWKSTVIPDSDEYGDLVIEGNRHRGRVGTFLSHALRPLSSRSRRDSGSSALSEDISRSDHHPHHSPVTKPHVDSMHHRPLSYNAPKSPRPLHQSPSNDALFSNTLDNTIPPRPSTQSSSRGQLLRRSFTETTVPRLTDLLPPDMSEGLHDIPPPVPPKDALPTPPASTRWRFFPFRRETSQTVISQETMGQPLHPTKGDILCVDYSSLDDRGMRRLEGRSDHRPVIGSYAVYL